MKKIKGCWEDRQEEEVESWEKQHYYYVTITIFIFYAWIVWPSYDVLIS